VQKTALPEAFKIDPLYRFCVTTDVTLIGNKTMKPTDMWMIAQNALEYAGHLYDFEDFAVLAFSRRGSSEPGEAIGGFVEPNALDL
jgi:hypothetical protein